MESKEFSSVVNGIQSNVKKENISDLIFLGNNIDIIKEKIESEVESGKHYSRNSSDWKRECSRRIGILGEYIASLGFLLKVPFFTDKYGPNFSLYGWDKTNKIPNKINSILDLSSGSSAGGEIDILIIDEVIKKIYCFSSKFKNIYDGTIHWSDMEIDRMPIIESKNIKSLEEYKDFGYGTFIFDRSHIVNNCKKYSDTIIYDWKDVDVIWKQVYSILQYNKFDCNKLNNIISGGSKQHLVPRFHQKKAAEAAMTYWNKEEGKFYLYDHICRSGKTITALYTCQQMKFNNVLLITSFPCINEMEWSDTVDRFYDFSYWNVVNYSGHKGEFDSDKSNFVMISFQDLKSNDVDNNCYGLDKSKFDSIRGKKWDCIIIDEVHYGYETEKSKNIMEGFDFSHCLCLSATPFVNYFRNTFDSSNTHRWTLFDEKEMSKDYPYYAEYPKMNFLLFSPPKKVYEDYLQEYIKEDGLTFRKLLKIKGSDTFFYEKDIKTIVKFIFGEKDSENRYNSMNTPFNYSREEIGGSSGNGILIFVPECIHCKPLQQILLNNEMVKHIFGSNVHYTYSDLNKSGELKGWLKKNANPPFIIIAVGQLTTGVTVAGVDTVILMDDTESPQQIMQRMFRCRTATKGKKEAFVIDLNPTRTFKMIYEYTATLAEIDKEDQISYFKKFFKLMPIVYCKDNKFIDVEKDIVKIFQEASSKYYDCFGKASLINDIPDSVAVFLNNIKFNRKGSKSKYTEGIDKGKTVKKNDKIDGESKKEDVDNDVDNTVTVKEKIISILQSLCWASVLSGCKFNRYDEIFEYLDKNPNLKCEYDKLLF